MGINFNIDYGFAGGVIVTGLVIVFLALVGLTLVVMLLGKILYSISGGSKKTPEKKVQEAPKQAPAPKAMPVKPAMVVEEGIGDEIVAVIAAAVAAMSGDGKQFALRSVKRVKEARSSWCTAGLVQNTQPF
ncbi:OadG family protein [Youxingia wuxianensis]|uniref:OadG family protein n=1 Tax=Youxingia wuxianensis TaxID=2763678 RepID=A0A926EQ17_9FIRM|nr:OadG family protein [Youxingia wuxianensis]MBC8584449.1 OadG family protein [Youxingia wuxianensis]